MLVYLSTQTLNQHENNGVDGGGVQNSSTGGVPDTVASVLLKLPVILIFSHVMHFKYEECTFLHLRYNHTLKLYTAGSVLCRTKMLRLGAVQPMNKGWQYKYILRV